MSVEEIIKQHKIDFTTFKAIVAENLQNDEIDCTYKQSYKDGADDMEQHILAWKGFEILPASFKKALFIHMEDFFNQRPHTLGCYEEARKRTAQNHSSQSSELGGARGNASL